MNPSQQPASRQIDPLRLAIVWSLLGLVLIGITVATGWKFYQDREEKLMPKYGSVMDFEFMERSGTPMGKKKLHGKVWISDFIFTRCGGPCPRMSQQMAGLQDELKSLGNLRFVSFTVDPKHDTPEVLRDYAARYQATDRWFFLTGDEKQIHQFARESFRVAVQREVKDQHYGDESFLHSTYFLLIDRKGFIRGYYESANPEAMEQLKKDATRLATAGGMLPHLNALLNSSSTVLLLLGLWAVRTRRLILHRNLMFAAIGTSAAFLISYLLYHFGFVMTKPYAGPARNLYLTILLTHTVLAMGVLPLVLATAFQALQAQREDPKLISPELSQRFRKHVRIARWTFPIWLYVSVTGVVIYYMLYHLS
jgi:protein SCO1